MQLPIFSLKALTIMTICQVITFALINLAINIGPLQTRIFRWDIWSLSLVMLSSSASWYMYYLITELFQKINTYTDQNILDSIFTMPQVWIKDPKAHNFYDFYIRYVIRQHGNGVGGKTPVLGVLLKGFKKEDRVNGKLETFLDEGCFISLHDNFKIVHRIITRVNHPKIHRGVPVTTHITLYIRECTTNELSDIYLSMGNKQTTGN